MHSYLKAIGFSDITEKKELDTILQDVIQNYDEKTVVEDRSNHLFTELSKMYGCDFGITVCGEYDEDDQFQMEYYFPYFRGTGITMEEEVVIEKHAGKESYAGACDDMRIGVTIIFYLQNAGEYLTQRCKGHYAGGVHSLTLSGLAKKGTILLPVLKQEAEAAEAEEKTMKRLFVILLAALFSMGSIGAEVLASASLKVMLVIPPRPITVDMADGIYDGYMLSRSTDTIFVTAD